MNITALKEAAEKATPGPWNVDPMHCVYAGNPENGTRQDVADNAWHNAPFIALANPSTILSLIERCEELEGALFMLRNTAGDLKNGFAPFVEPSRWVDQFQAVADAALSKADATS